MTTPDDKRHDDAQHIMPDSEFNELLHQQINVDIKFMEENHSDSFTPQLYMYTRPDPTDGKRKLIVMMIAGDFNDKKQETMYALGRKVANEIKDVEPVAVFMTSEAWMRAIPPEDADTVQQGKKKISDYPDKQECIITAGLTIDGRANMAVTPVTRSATNTMVFAKAQINDYDYTNGNQAENNLLKAFFRGYAYQFGLDRGWFSDEQKN